MWKRVSVRPDGPLTGNGSGLTDGYINADEAPAVRAAEEEALRAAEEWRRAAEEEARRAAAPGRGRPLRRRRSRFTDRTFPGWSQGRSQPRVSRRLLRQRPSRWDSSLR